MRFMFLPCCSVLGKQSIMRSVLLPSIQNNRGRIMCNVETSLFGTSPRTFPREDFASLQRAILNIVRLGVRYLTSG